MHKVVYYAGANNTGDAGANITAKEEEDYEKIFGGFADGSHGIDHAG